MGSEAEQDAVKSPKPVAAAAEMKPKRAKAPKAKPKKRAKRKPVRAAKTKPARKAPAKPAPKPKAARKQTSKADRAKIVAVADREGLTALQIQKRFGVKPVTYYSWRKASKKTVSRNERVTRGPSAKAADVLGGVDLAAQVRQAVRNEIARMLPGMIQAEVAAMLGGSARGGSRQRK
jgi:transposase-like protein